MKPANYAVIRYVADPGRNEALNIGAVIWNQSDFRIRVDEAAVDRVVRENPWLDKDTLLYIRAWLEDKVRQCSEDHLDCVPKVLTEQDAFPVRFTEARYTSIQDPAPDGIDRALSWLIDRVVRPYTPPRGGSSRHIGERLEGAVRPLIRTNRVTQAYAFRGHRTGIARTVDFYANSGTNVAVDTLRLAITKADEIRRRVDAQAYKVLDRDPESIERFIILCELSDDGNLAAVNRESEETLVSEGAEFHTDVEKVALILAESTG